MTWLIVTGYEVILNEEVWGELILQTSLIDPARRLGFVILVAIFLGQTCLLALFAVVIRRARHERARAVELCEAIARLRDPREGEESAPRALR